MTKIKNVIFDLGAVILDWNPEAIVDKHTNDTDKKAIYLNELFHHDDWIRLDEGTLSEVEVQQRFAKRSGFSQADVEIVFARVRDYLQPMAPSIELLNSLHDQGLKLYCLSNISDEFYQYLNKAHDFFKKFTGVVISAQEKLVKPNPAIYTLLLNRYNLIAEETAFLDDRQDNIDGAKSMGIQGLVFTPIPERLQQAKDLIFA